MRRFLFLPAVACVLHLLAVTSHADREICYDLDSLVYLSTDIVEAIVTGTEDDVAKSTKFEIAVVHMGGLRQRQTISIQYPDSPRTLKAGDRAFLFLVTDSAQGKAGMYRTVESGVKLVEGDNVQTVEGHRFKLRDEKVGVDEYQTLLAASIKQVAEWKKRLEGEFTLKDGPWLLELLKARLKLRGSDLDDHILEVDTYRLAALRDPETLEAAFEISGWTVTDLAYGLASPAGREYALKIIAGDKLPMNRRVRMAEALREGRGNYYCTYAPEKGSWRGTGLPVEGNARFLTRIAELAVQNRPQPELCRALIHTLDYIAHGIADDKYSVAMLSDAEAALKLLKEIYEGTADQQLRFEIEWATFHASPGAYAKLKPACGPILTILRTPSQKFGTPPGSIGISYEFWSLGGETLAAPDVIFLNKDTQQKYSSPFNNPHLKSFGPTSQGGRGLSVILPKDLPPGTYHIYLQFTRDGKIVSEGHYFETKL